MALLASAAVAGEFADAVRQLQLGEGWERREAGAIGNRDLLIKEALSASLTPMNC